MTPADAQRTVVIGDIHGCHRELVALLEAVDLQPEDRLIPIGDVVGKGPHSRAALDFVLGRPNTQPIQGNAEWRLVTAWRDGEFDSLPLSLEDFADELDDDLDSACAQMATWPLWRDLGDVLCVHAGVRPGVPLAEQRPYDLMHIRRVKPHTVGCAVGLSKPWWDLHAGPPHVVFGHTPHTGVIEREWATGLDTGCVYGGSLTALVLPERRLVQVPAERQHCPDKELGPVPPPTPGPGTVPP